jgi:hypothetical protein
MRRGLLRGAAWAIALAGVLIGGVARAEPTADELYAQARALVQEGKLEEALGRLRAAYAQKQSHDIAGNLGLVEAELGLNVPAEQHLEAALRTFPVTGKPESRAVLEKRLVDVRAKLAEVVLRVDRAGAEVMVDGERVGTTPLDEPLTVDPRQHRVTVRLDGYRSEDVWVAPAAGKEVIVDLALEVAPPQRATPTHVVPVATTRSSGSGFDRARPWLVGASGVVLASGLVVGLTSVVLSNGHAAEIEALKTELPAGRGCVGGDVPDVCLPIGDQIGRKDATAAVATGAFITAGIGLALGLTFLLVPGGEDELASAPQGARIHF